MSLRDHQIFVSRAFIVLVSLVSLTGCTSSGPFGANPPRLISNASMYSRERVYVYTTLVNPVAPTPFTLQKFNDKGVIVGFYGSGSPQQPLAGFSDNPPYGPSDFDVENVPGAVQTAVTSINARGDTAGYYINSVGVNIGFANLEGKFFEYPDPLNPEQYRDNHILGINDKGQAVGFYLDTTGASHAYQLDLKRTVYTELTPGSTPVAWGINDKADIVGVYGQPGRWTGYLLHDGSFTKLTFPGSTWTFPTAISNKDEIVGSYRDATGTHGFTLIDATTNPVWNSIDEPDGVLGSTGVTGVNNSGNLTESSRVLQAAPLGS